ncbi:pilus assembly protein TadG-related protein [Longispora fulva]|uniref:Putative Flp pilus-assembly TadG-like N-terminal domain-containing protein n=2 Tax=Longispora fulva TaxID=619741 RepID=A0A8J7GE97_9ACTN|nr:pilus assembly protein TadG-related protein [Longispora fulva]MBG6136270.1 hypothetical protein [Longispora fulva]
MRSRVKAQPAGDAGVVSVTMACVGMIVVLMAAILLGGGSVFAARTRAYDLAAEAARAGAQHIDLAAYRAGGVLRLDPGPAVAAARRYLAAAGAQGQVMVAGLMVTVTATSVQRTPMLAVFGRPTVLVTATASATPSTGGDP